MALVEFTNNQAPYINAENLNNNFNELQANLGVKAYTIIQSVNVNSSYQNDLLKDAKLVICNWTNDTWDTQTFHITNGYSLNTYANADNGSIYNSSTGTITAQYSSSNMYINKILVIK